MTLESIGGILFAVLAVGVLVLMYVKNVDAIYSDMAHEEAERLADERFEQYKRNMKIRVTQTLRIVDERNLTK